MSRSVGGVAALVAGVVVAIVVLAILINGSFVPGHEASVAPEKESAVAAQEGKPEVATAAAPEHARTAHATDAPLERSALPEEHVASRIKLSGRLTLRDQPVGGEELLLRPGASAGHGLPVLRVTPDGAQSSSGEQRTTTAADGTFSFYLTSGRSVGLALARDKYVFRDIETDEVAVPAQQKDRDLGNVPLASSCRVSGVVQDRSGRRLADVQVSLSRGSPVPFVFGVPRNTTKTAADGTFTISGVKDGTYNVHTASAQHVPLRKELKLGSEEQKVGLVLELAEGGVIAGTVIDDLGRPVEGAQVAATRRRQVNAGFTFEGISQQESVRTDRSGSFSIGGVDAEQVTVSAWHDELASASQLGVARGTGNLVLQLKRRGAVEGRLLDTDGNPVAGSNVRATPTGGGEPMRMFMNSGGVKTAADGTFKIDKVDPGNVQLVAEGEDHRPTEPVPVVVQPGQTCTNVQLVAQRGTTVEALVVDGKGKPVVDADVKVSEFSESVADAPTPGRPVTRRIGMRMNAGGAPVMLDSEGAVLGSARTDAEGKARIRGLPSKRVAVTAAHADLVGPKAVNLALPPSGTVKTEVTMLRGGSLDLHVVDANGEPLAHADVTVQSNPATGSADAVGEPVKRNGSTDSDGDVHIGPLLPGSYIAALRLAPPPMQMGGMQFMVAGSEGAELEGSRVRVEVKEGATTEAKIVRPVLTTVRGTVRDARGPVAGARVELRPSSSGVPRGLGGSYNATTDEAGKFAIESLPSGTFRARFGRREAPVMAEEPIEIPPGQPEVVRNFVLTGGVIELLVVVDDKAAPVADARVQLERQSAQDEPRQEMRVAMAMTGGPGGPQQMRMNFGNTGVVTTDAEGHAVLKDVPAGKYTVVIEHDGYARQQVRDVEVLVDATKDLGRVAVGAGGTIKGRVLKPDGSVADLGMVRYEKEGDRNVRAAQNGRFSLTGLAEGTYRLSASAVGTNDDWGQAVEVKLKQGESREVDITLPK